ncbi:hypothetical protein CRENBAI_001899 [Crenichthys baileyi]|uniref:Uncharacterized protein n=1 Tax=Crenichthys baileyi TaxID=28760 RepID=A0AAV9SFA0_9TELE
MPLPARCLTSLVPIIDPVSVPGLLSQPSPWIKSPASLTCAVEIPAYYPLRFPLRVSSSTQDKISDPWKLCGV